jgi:hypothetical protein
MAGTAKKTNPALWEKSKAAAKAKMGGEHSARAMQLAVQMYKKQGGGYVGAKSKDNKLAKWTKEDWDYSSKKQEGEGRYLPKKVWSKLSPGEKAATNAAKKKGTAEGKQFVAQPEKVAEKAAKIRKRMK